MKKMNKKFDQVVALFGVLAIFAALVFALLDLYMMATSKRLHHEKWVTYNPTFECNEEPIWGPEDHGDQILGWHLVEEPGIKRFIFVKLNSVPPPDNVWLACNGYQSFTVPVDKTGMSYRETVENKDKKKIFFKFVDCLSGGSTIIAADAVQFDGSVEMPVDVWQNSYAGQQLTVSADKDSKK